MKNEIESHKDCKKIKNEHDVAKSLIKEFLTALQRLSIHFGFQVLT